MNATKVLVLVGPTAVGKTATSIRLAKELNGEVINGDALQVYRELTIGTAKISDEEMEGVQHHLLSIKDPGESFSVAEYQQLVRSQIEDITARGKVPIVVGGTGLYIQAVLYDYRFEEAAPSDALRTQLEAREEGSLWEELKQLDPHAANAIHPNNKQRVIRALERVLQTGKKQQEIEQQAGRIAIYDFYLIGLNRDRAELYSRINERVGLMMRQGLVEEVKSILSHTSKEAQSLKAIGYKEVVESLEFGWPQQQLIETIQQNTRRYAKRQLTYFRNKLPIIWYHPEEDQHKILEDCRNFLRGN